MPVTVKLPQLVYECDSCGACCRHSVLEAEHYDALREPRIAAEATLLDGHGKIKELDEVSWSLNRRQTPEERAKAFDFSCVFLGGDNRCGIYTSRPHMCVAFQAGSEKCQSRRSNAGLRPLKPARKAESVLDRIHDSYRKGADDE